jgi:hypothetical protein
MDEVGGGGGEACCCWKGEATVIATEGGTTEADEDMALVSYLMSGMSRKAEWKSGSESGSFLTLRGRLPFSSPYRLVSGDELFRMKSRSRRSSYTSCAFCWWPATPSGDPGMAEVGDAKEEVGEETERVEEEEEEQEEGEEEEVIM